MLIYTNVYNESHTNILHITRYKTHPKHQLIFSVPLILLFSQINMFGHLDNHVNQRCGANFGRPGLKLFLKSVSVICFKTAFRQYGPYAGALDAESPKSYLINKITTVWSRNRCFPYGFAQYFACAELYTFPMVPAYSQPPIGL